jgi:hypothetical protein
MEMEEISLVRRGVVRANPATADVTETAGVNIPSANVSAVPNKLYYRMEPGSESKKGMNAAANTAATVNNDLVPKREEPI